MKKLFIVLFMMVAGSLSAAEYDYHAKKFHNATFNNGNHIDMPKITYTFESSDGYPVENLAVGRYVSYKKILSRYRPDISNRPVGNHLTNEFGQITFKAFSKLFVFNSKPEIRLDVMLFYPATQCAMSVNDMKCEERGQNDKNALDVLCTLKQSKSYIDNCGR